MSDEWETVFSSKKGKSQINRNNANNVNNIDTSLKGEFRYEWSNFKKLKNEGKLTLRICQEYKEAIERTLVALEDNYRGSEDEAEIQDLQQQLDWVNATYIQMESNNILNGDNIVDGDMETEDSLDSSESKTQLPSGFIILEEIPIVKQVPVKPLTAEERAKVEAKVNSINYYDALEISTSFTQISLRKQYHELAIIYHPDKNTQTPEALHLYTQAFQVIQSAYSCLSNSAERQRYDYYLQQLKMHTQYNVSEKGAYVGSKKALAKLNNETQKLVNELFSKQNGKCVISGIKFDKSKGCNPYLRNNIRKPWLPRFELVAHVFG